MALYVDGVEYGIGDIGPIGNGGGGGGGGISFAPPPAAAPSNLREFDLSPIQGLRGNQKFGGNLVSDIQSAYQTYISGTAVGRGGQYAVSAQRQYGYESLSQAAAVYLQAAGLKIKDAVAPTIEIFKPPPAPDPVKQADPPPPKDEDFFALPVPEKAVEEIRKPIEILADVFREAFGQAVYNPPLQSQATSYTPVPTAGAVAGGSGTPVAGGFGIGSILILAGLAIGAYFLYKRMKGGA